MNSSRPARKLRVVMAGGGTGGHVVPLIAVANVLRDRGHELLFVGTKTGFEARLAPEAGFPIEWIEIGGLMRVGLMKTVSTALKLVPAVTRSMGLLNGADAVFSMGGYVAGPVMIAAALKRIPMVVMEPNAMPGLTNRLLGKPARKVLLSFREAADHFSASQVEFTGLPVRKEFFAIRPKPMTGELNILITGGSRGSQRINNAVRGAWPDLKNLPVRIVHQTGTADLLAISKDFKETGLQGSVVPFIPDMPKAFSDAHLVICRSGAGTVSELAAAGRASVLIPFPFAADDHQLRNAQAMEREGAARIVQDKELTPERLVNEIRQFDARSTALMGEAARKLAKPNAAERAAEILEECAGA